MTKIAICDTTHFEVTYTIISLFNPADTDITIFIHREAYEQLKFLLGERTGLCTWVLKRDDESNRSFINRMFRHITQSCIDLLYLNTVSDNFILYAYHLQRLKAESAVMTLHDINGFFDYKPSLSIRRLIRHAGKRKLIKILPAFSVLSERLGDHLKSRLQSHKQVLVVPGRHFEPELFTEKEFQPGESIKIVIPGSVDIRRRDYDAVFYLLDAARQFEISISVTLLGGFSPQYGGSIKDRCLDRKSWSL